jgi:hypothetical protein
MTKLTALKIQKVKHPGNRAGPFMVSDGLGLSLQIMPGGSRSRPSSWCKFPGGHPVSIVHAAMVGNAGICSSLRVFMVSRVI